MASTHHLFCDGLHINVQIIEEDTKCDKERRSLHYASIIVQRTWRRFIHRKHRQELHDAATVLQKYVRRFLVRINMGNYMLEYLENRAMRFYNKKATKIQALWRGYQHRKNVFDFHAIYIQQQKVAKVNEELKQRMIHEKMLSALYNKQRVEIESKSMVLFILYKLHHLLRTHQPGIYSSRFTRDDSWIESLLKSVRFTSYMKALKKLYNKTYHEPDKRECVLTGRWTECEVAYYKRDKRNDLKPDPPSNPNEFLHEKRFCFDPRYVRKEEPPLLTQGKFKAAIKNVMRDFDKRLNICEADFDVTAKVTELVEKVPPYYIDFWSRTCEIHNLPDLLT